MSGTKTESWEYLEEEAQQQEEQKCRDYYEYQNQENGKEPIQN
jgi:hypothetical protein